MAPLVVVVVSTVQLLLAATFLVIPVVGRRHGPRAQRAAEAAVGRQGFPATVLAERGIDFGASRGSVVLAVGIGGCLAALALLNLSGVEAARITTFVVQSLVLVGGGLVIMPGEVFTTWYVRAAFRRSGDPAVRGMDVGAFVDAARGAYPRWFPPVVATRFALATLGSVAVLVLLAVPPATAYFR